MKSKKKLKRNLVLSFVSGLGVMAILSVVSNFDKLIKIITGVPVWLFIICFSLYFVIYLVDSLRLKIVIAQFGYTLPFLHLLANGVLGSFYANITPFAAGGQPYQIYQLSKGKVKTDVAAATIMIRFSEYLLTSVIVSVSTLIYLIVKGEIIFSNAMVDSMLYIGLGISVAVTAFFLLSMFKTKTMLSLPLKILTLIGKHAWAEKLQRFTIEMHLSILKLSEGRKYILAADLLLGFVNLSLQGISLWIALSFFSSTVLSPVFVTMMFVLMNLVVYFLPTPGASGGIEGFYALIFSYFTGNPVGTTASIIVWRFSTYYMHIIFQIIFNIVYNRRSSGEDSNADVVFLSS